MDATKLLSSYSKLPATYQNFTDGHIIDWFKITKVTEYPDTIYVDVERDSIRESKLKFTGLELIQFGAKNLCTKILPAVGDIVLVFASKVTIPKTKSFKVDKIHSLYDNMSLKAVPIINYSNANNLVSVDNTKLEADIFNNKVTVNSSKLEASVCGNDIAMNNSEISVKAKAGKIELGNSIGTIGAMLSDLIQTLSTLTTAGTAAAQTISPATVAQLTTWKTKWLQIFK